ncbi:MAG: 2-(1,2-epoxy-1,2-dihydrophenyl)acetyl-CoA isomerase, partial [Gammaproteobacteria bacterium]|nr:2-(1,2-epoxy-1,2-dihydrophenyl)acetyl-CoA isomerase [Gammaproteobacteria bacterium]
MDLNRVILDFDDNVAVLRFNHPEVMNAVGVDMLEGLADALREIQDPNNGARCVLITGEGRGFCAGANLSDTKRPKHGAGASLRGGT